MRGRLARLESSLDTAPDICDLIDAVVLGEGDDHDVAEQLVVIELWSKYLRELLRDAGREPTKAVVVANQADELEERLR